MAPTPSALRSAFDQTATTPGAAAAADASIETMRAGACGERRHTSPDSPGSPRAALKRPRPATRRASSIRFCEREAPKRADSGSNWKAGAFMCLDGLPDAAAVAAAGANDAGERAAPPVSDDPAGGEAVDLRCGEAEH